MSFGDYVKNGFKILGFSKEAVGAIAADAESKKHSFILTAVLAALYALFFAVVMSIAASAIGGSALGGAFGVGAFIGMFVAFFVFMIVSYGVLHLSARLLGGNASIFQIYAVGASTFLPILLITFVFELIQLFAPAAKFLVIVVYIYEVVLLIFMVRETYVFSTGRAIAAVLVPIIVALLILALLFASLMTAFAFA